MFGGTVTAAHGWAKRVSLFCVCANEELSREVFQRLRKTENQEFDWNWFSSVCVCHYINHLMGRASCEWLSQNIFFGRCEEEGGFC